jgi:BirA family biotin operon repressor/biotin-[acetyl-CoA-carboxylase] ligase
VSALPDDGPLTLITLDSVDSTSDEARRRILAGTLRGPAVVVAREQTAGRGTNGRTWVSPRDAGLYMSVVDDLACEAAVSLQALVLAGAFAAVEWLRDGFGIDVCVKPLNDLMSGGRKLGGVLTEAHFESQQLRCVMSGVGINLRAIARPLPVGVEAVSVEELCGTPPSAGWDNEAMVLDVARRILAWNRAIVRQDFAVLRDAWRRLGTPGTATPIGLGDID